MIDYTTIITAAVASTIAISGWLVNSHLQRKHRIFEIRTEKRISMFNEVDQTRTTILHNIIDGGGGLELDRKIDMAIEKSYKSVQLYGYEDEIKMYTNFIDALKQKDIEKIKQTLSCFDLFRVKLRKELGIPKKAKNETSGASK